MKKIFSLLLVLIVSLSALFSCKIGGDGDGEGSTSTPDPTPDTTPEVGAIWDSDDEVYIVTNEENLDLHEFGLTFNSVSGILPVISTDSEPKPMELIIGEADRPIAETANAKVNRLFSNTDGKSMWLIYSDGSSVAIAYVDTIGRYAALDYFLTEYKNINFNKKGIVAREEFVVSEYAAQKREEQREAGFATMEGKISDSAIDALRDLYNFYDEDIYMWLANLWCPDVGGFYYSESARDTHGFLPDIESTMQALSMLKSSGLLQDYGGSYKKAIPEDMQESLVAFAKGLQDSEDGYFYHPQWGKDVGISRRGRDLGWAVQLIVAFGAQPYWDTPNGRDGEYGAPGGASAASLTGRLGTSSAVAASKAIPTSTLPTYLRSLEAFENYLKSFDWVTNSYNAGNTIDAQMGQIGNAGKEYKKLLIDFLNSRQYAHNGLWEPQTDYDSVNGLMKISGVYRSCEATIPNAEAAMNSAMQIALTPDGAAHVCSVYNPWVAMNYTIESVRTTAGAERAEELRQMLRDNAETLIRITTQKLSVFIKPDGGFSYYPTHSATRSQGVTVALSASESDVNATGICSNGTVTHMLEAMGLDNVYRFCPEDYLIFLDTVEGLGSIIKDEIPPAETITFDDAPAVSSPDGVTVEPTDYVYNSIGDEEMDSNRKYKWFESNIVPNPDPNASENDLVLYGRDFTYSGEEKTMADAGSSTWFNIANAGVGSQGNCFIFDADMYFASGTGVLCQLSFTGDIDEGRPCASLNFNTYTDNGVTYVKIGENYAGLDGVKDANVAGGIPMNEWVNIRIEFIKTYEDIEDPVTGLTDSEYFPKLKVYVNGKYQGECDANITGGGTYYDRKVTNVAVSYYRLGASEMYFNNVLVERTQKQYEQEINPDAIVDPALPDEPMRETADFEDGLLNTSNVNNKLNITYFGESVYINASEDQTYNPTVSYSIADDPTGIKNKVLRVAVAQTKQFQASQTKVNLYNSDSEGTTYTFSAEFYYDAESIRHLADVTQLFFSNASGKSNYSVRIAARSSGGVTTLSLIEYNTQNKYGDTGSGKTIYENIPTNKWFNLKIEFHKTLDAATTVAKFYIDGVEIYDDYSYKIAALNDTELVSINITHQRTNTSTVYLDDLSFVRSDLEFIPIPPPPVKEPVADFESDDIGGDYLDNYITALENGTTVRYDANEVENMEDYSAYTTYYLVDDPTGAVNKVLKVVKQKNTEVSSSSTVVNLAGDPASGSCYVFETKLYIESIGGYDVMRLTVTDGQQNLVSFRLYNQGSVWLRQNNGGTGGTGSGDITDYSGASLALPKSQWFTLRIEFYKTNDSSTTMTKISVTDGDTVITAAELPAYTAYGNTESRIPASMNVTHYNSGNGYTMYFDDVSFTVIDKEFVSDVPEKEPEEETPTDPDTGGGEVEGGGTTEPETPTVPDENAIAVVLPVYGGANGIVTFMHDDGVYDSVIEIDKLLVKYGLVSDMALIASKATANYPTVKKWQGVLATGRWKVTSHSMTHSWWGIEPEDGDVTKVTDDTEKAIREFVESQQLLKETFPGQRVLTFAYPRFSSIYDKYIYTDGELDEEKLLTYMDSAYIRALVEQYYVAGRVNSGVISLDGVSEVDWEYMPGTHVHNNVNEVVGLVDDAAANGNFCLLYTHDVKYAEDGIYVSNATPSWQIDAVFAAIKEKVDAGLIWNTHYEDAVLYIREAETATVTAEGDENGYTVLLTDKMDDTVYNHALTVKLKAYDSWEAVKVVQGDSVSYAAVTTRDGERCVLVNIIPDGGEAAVTPVSLSEVPEEEESEVIPTPTLTRVDTFEEGFNTEFVENIFVTKDGEKVDPETTDISASADYSSMSIAQDPVNAANRVLQMVNKSGSAGNGTNTTAYISNEDPTGSCFVFETRLYLDDLTGGTADNVIMTYRFTLDGTISNVLSLAIKHTASSETAKLVWNNGTDYTGNGEIAELGIDTWYSLRIEFYQTGDAETTRCKVYLTPDGEEETLVTDEIAYSYWGVSSTAPQYVKIVYARYKTKYTVCLDDISFSQIDKEAGELTEEENPTDPDTGGGEVEGGGTTESETPTVGNTGVQATFEDGNLYTPYVESFLYVEGVLTSVKDITDMDSQSPVGYYLAADPTDAANTVLNVKKSSSTPASGETPKTEVYFSNEDPTGNCYTLSTRLYVASITSGKNVIQIRFGNSSSNSLMLNFAYNDTTNTIDVTSNGQYAKPAAAETTIASIPMSSWVNMRMEFYYNGTSATTTDTYLKFYLDTGDGEVLTYDGIAYYWGSKLKGEPDSYVSIMTYRGNQESDIYFDDIYATKTDKAYEVSVIE